MKLRLLLAVVCAWPCFSQTAKTKVLYFPKPVRPPAYQPPMKPLVRLADLKAKNKGRSDWSELVILDNNSRAQVISAAPGFRTPRRLHPDSPEWWVVQQGRIRFEIEVADGKFEVIEARKGSYVFAPERRLHSLEVVGTEPAIRFEVTLAETTSVYEAPPAGARDSGIEYIPVTLQTGANPSDVPNAGGQPDRIHFNVEDLAASHRDKSAWTESVMRKNRVRGNLICGYARDNPKRGPDDRGHFHGDFAEFWIVMCGRLNWIMEGAGTLVAEEGDIIYAPPKTFHAPEFAGEGLACRLTSSTFPAANHIYDAR